MRMILLAAVVLLSAVVGACGQTGPLYHPPPEQQGPAPDGEDSAG
jgi:predicted small lipoprotein YifL